MLIDLRELLSGSQDEKSYKADIEMNTFNTGSSDYDIIEKPAVDVMIKKLGKNKLSIKADSYVTLSIPCDRCLEPVDTRVDYTVDEIVDFNDNASEEEAKEEKTKSGIFLPDTAKEKPQEGVVVAVGAGKVYDNGQRVAPEVKVGDTVMFAKYAGSELEIDGATHLIISERDILAVL